MDGDNEKQNIVLKDEMKAGNRDQVQGDHVTRILASDWLRSLLVGNYFQMICLDTLARQVSAELSQDRCL